jgi:hypothetical protein
MTRRERGHQATSMGWAARKKYVLIFLPSFVSSPVTEHPISRRIECSTVVKALQALLFGGTI